MTTERPGPSRLLTGAFLAAALVVGAALGALEINGLASPLDRIENLTLDWRFLLAGPRPAPAGVAIVAIDDETLSESGGDAPTREMMARIVRTLAGFHPRSVAIDIAFIKARDPGADAELARALKATPAVVAAIGEFDAVDSFRPSSRIDRSGVGAEAVLGSLANRGDPRCGASGACQRFDELERSASLHSDDLSDFRWRDSVLRARRGVTEPASEPVLGHDRIEIAGHSREMDLGYHMPLRFYGPAGSFKRISATKVLRGGLDPEALRGKVVVVGVTATGASDTFATPFDRVAPGAEVFATAIGNLLAGDGLARTPSTRRIDAAAAVALPVVMIALMAMRRAGDRANSREPGVCPLARGGLSRLRQRLLAQRRRAACVSPAADCRLRRGSIHCRTSGRDENRRREVDAGQVSVAASSRPPSKRA